MARKLLKASKHVTKLAQTTQALSKLADYLNKGTSKQVKRIQPSTFTKRGPQSYHDLLENMTSETTVPDSIKKKLQNPYIPQYRAIKAAKLSHTDLVQKAAEMAKITNRRLADIEKHGLTSQYKSSAYAELKMHLRNKNAYDKNPRLKAGLKTLEKMTDKELLKQIKLADEFLTENTSSVAGIIYRQQDMMTNLAKRFGIENLTAEKLQKFNDWVQRNDLQKIFKLGYDSDWVIRGFMDSVDDPQGHIKELEEAIKRDVNASIDMKRFESDTKYREDVQEMTRIGTLGIRHNSIEKFKRKYLDKDLQ